MARSQHRAWLVLVLHGVGLIGVVVSIATSIPSMNQLILVTYLGTLLLLEFESWWFGAAALIVVVIYLTLTGAQHQLIPAHELLATDSFYLLLALIIARIREERARQWRGPHA